MSDFITNIPLIQDLSQLVEWLLLLNIILIGVVILLAFRINQYKEHAEELEHRLNESISETIARHSPEENVPHRRSRRS